MSAPSIIAPLQSRGFDWTANAGRHNRENTLRVRKKATERGSFTLTKYAARDAGHAFNEHRDGQAPRTRHDEDQSNAGLSDWNQEPNSAPRGDALMSFYNEIAWSTRSSKRGANSKTEKGKPEEVKGALDDDHNASKPARNHTGEDTRPSFPEKTSGKDTTSTTRKKYTREDTCPSFQEETSGKDSIAPAQTANNTLDKDDSRTTSAKILHYPRSLHLTLVADDCFVSRRHTIPHTFPTGRKKPSDHIIPGSLGPSIPRGGRTNPPGSTPHPPFSSRSGCRLTIIAGPDGTWT